MSNFNLARFYHLSILNSYRNFSSFFLLIFLVHILNKKLNLLKVKIIFFDQIMSKDMILTETQMIKIIISQFPNVNIIFTI